tara:strand:+ start:591 stop:1046 length:456 start_codon:yes stop_codon:yes gene_type:complete
MINKHNIKIDKMLSDATNPNSDRSLLFVVINVANPEAVVTLVINVAFPIFVITFSRATCLIPCVLSSRWYLLIRKMQLGIPITIISGGIIAVSTVNSYSKSPTIPRVHITPIETVKTEIIVALKDLKNKKNIRDVTIAARIRNLPNSAFMV